MLRVKGKKITTTLETPLVIIAYYNVLPQACFENFYKVFKRLAFLNFLTVLKVYSCHLIKFKLL